MNSSRSGRPQGVVEGIAQERICEEVRDAETQTAMNVGAAIGALGRLPLRLQLLGRDDLGPDELPSASPLRRALHRTLLMPSTQGAVSLSLRVAAAPVRRYGPQARGLASAMYRLLLNRQSP